jgi:hypothetical protein
MLNGTSPLAVLTDLTFEPLEIGRNQINVSSELVIVKLDLTDGEHNLSPVRMRQYPNRIRHHSPGRQRHIMIEHSELIPFNETDFNTAHRRINQQSVTVPDHLSPGETCRPLRQIPYIRCVLIHRSWRGRDYTTYVPALHNRIIDPSEFGIKGRSTW